MKILIALSFLILLGSAKAPEGSTAQKPIEIMVAVAEEPVIESDPVLPIGRFLEYVEWEEAPQVGVFVSDGNYAPRVSFRNKEGANQLCRDEATNKGYSTKFPESTRAFLFTSGDNVREFLPSTALIIRLQDYKRITTYGNLLKDNSTLMNSFSTNSRQYYSWTGLIQSDTNPRVGETCGNWTRQWGTTQVIHTRKTRLTNTTGYCQNVNNLICMVAMDIYPLHVIDQ